VNITGCDVDLEVSFLARLTPHQRWLKIHRWQHFFLWRLYGLMISRWQLFGDFHDLITGRMGGHQFARPKGWALATFLGGKLVFLALAFGIPTVFHPVGAVLALYLVATTVLGVVMAVVFQLAHAVEPAAFPAPRPATGRIDNCWAVHQAQTTVNFARRSRLAFWLLGGAEFPDRTPPVPPNLPCSLPGHVACGRGHLQGVRCRLCRARIDLGGGSLALPLATADG
jgi:linoleoyl-CoA desaturase